MDRWPGLKLGVIDGRKRRTRACSGLSGNGNVTGIGGKGDIQAGQLGNRNNLGGQ
jgi:hypothetical protein